jgi:hypothetical protein
MGATGQSRTPGTITPARPGYKIIGRTRQTANFLFEHPSFKPAGPVF